MMQRVSVWFDISFVMCFEFLYHFQQHAFPTTWITSRDSTITPKPFTNAAFFAVNPCLQYVFVGSITSSSIYMHIKLRWGSPSQATRRSSCTRLYHSFRFDIGHIHMNRSVVYMLCPRALTFQHTFKVFFAQFILS